MTNLSPEAQVVLDAFLGDAEHTGLQMDDLRENVAAALRAVANHCKCDDGHGYWIYRPNILAIADELEAH